MGIMKKSNLVIRLALYGCTNRPFFYFVATRRRTARNRGYFEQVGTYDPMPNERNEKLVSLNIDRIKYWLSMGAEPSRTAGILLGLSGLLPVHPHSIEIAKRNNELKMKENTQQNEESSEPSAVEEETTSDDK